MPQPEPSPLTRALRSGFDEDTAWNSIIPPLYLGTNFRFPELGAEMAYAYGRSGNPTRDQLGRALALLEHGAGAVVTASGLAAITLVLECMLPPGGRVVAAHDAYGGTWRLLVHLAGTGRLRVDFVDLTDPEAAARALAEPADLVWIETPSNPLMRITDIALVAGLGHAAGARVIADNTFCSPVLQHPLDLGCDVVVHSTTKFINGHSDSVGGVAVAATAELAEELGFWANMLGLTGGPFDAYLTLRGLRTITARLEVHQRNTAAIVDLLTSHPAVRTVHYPGLASHPGHQLALAQQSGFGSLLSFELVGGRTAAERFCSDLRVFDLAESLGGVESLVAHPSTMTHAAMSDEAKATAGITEGLLRLSVGIEPVADLLADISAALDRAALA